MEEREKKNFKDMIHEVILPKVEMIGAVLLFIAISLRAADISGFNQLLTIALTTMATVYYLRAFTTRKSSAILEIIIIRVGFISSSIIFIGVLFHTLSLSGAKEMLTIGSVALGLASVLTIYKLSGAQTGDYKTLLARFAFVFFVQILFLVL